MKRKIIVILAMMATLGLTACGNSEADTPSPTVIVQSDELETPTPTPPVIRLGGEGVECKELNEAEVGDVVLFGKDELAWWVVEKDEDSAYLLCAYIIDHSTYVEEVLLPGFTFSYQYKIFNDFKDIDYRKEFFSSSDMEKMLPTGDTLDGEDLYMTIPDVEEMVRWFPDLLVSDTFEYTSIIVNFLNVKEGADKSDIRLNPPVAPHVSVELDEEDEYAINYWWLAESMLQNNKTLYIPFWDGLSRFYMYNYRIENYCDGPYGGVRPVIKVKVD